MQPHLIMIFSSAISDQGLRPDIIKELTILGRERRPRLHKTKTAITETKAV